MTSLPSEGSRMIYKSCRNVKLFLIDDSIVVNFSLWFFHGIHLAAFLKRHPVFLGEFPPEELEPLGLGPQIIIVASVYLQQLPPFPDDLLWIWKIIIIINSMINLYLLSRKSDACGRL
jgi:hypothetical protein